MDAETAWLAHCLFEGATFEQILGMQAGPPDGTFSELTPADPQRLAEESQMHQQQRAEREAQLRAQLDCLCEQGHPAALRERAKLSPGD